MSRFRNPSRSSSALDYATATGASFNDVLHSTPQMGNTNSQQDLNLGYNHFPDPAPTVHSADGSEDMSIEIGRGLKRGAREQLDYMSSDAALGFDMGDSQHEITATPPIRSRKNETSLRREVSLRRASETAQAKDGLRRDNKHRSVSGNMRGSRFSPLPTKFTADDGLRANQRPAGFANTTIQSTTYTTNHSFLVPDVAGITEVIAGPRTEGTPVLNRTSVSRSRFTSASYHPGPYNHRSISAVTLPDDEKAIFASIHLMKDRNVRHEKGNNELQAQLEERENRIFELQDQLRYATERPDSDLGSDEDTMANDKSKSRVGMAALHARVAKYERTLAAYKKNLEHITKERDELVTQIGSAYVNNEQLMEEVEVLRESVETLQVNKDELRTKIDTLQAENDELRRKHEKLLAKAMRSRTQQLAANVETMAQTGAGNENITNLQSAKQDRSVRSKKEGTTGRRKSIGQADNSTPLDIVTRVEKEVKRQRDEALSRGPSESAPQVAPARYNIDRKTNNRTRSESQQRQRQYQAGRSGNASAPAELELSDAESTTDLNFTKSPRRSRATKTERVAAEPSRVEEDQDYTVLSDIDPEELANLRRKLEAELRAKRHPKHAFAREQTTLTGTIRNLPRKSSLKDIAAAFDQGTGRLGTGEGQGEDATRVSKIVRVQSPHTSDEISQPAVEEPDETGQLSSISNISRRRRRRVASNNGDTSAFIIPDITMHQRAQSLPADLETACVKHIAAECTLCAKPGKKVEIPVPVPVNEREGIEDLTNATVRPSQPPSDALAAVIKHLEDEVKHLKIQRDQFNVRYTQHDPALSKRKREAVRASIDRLTDDIERRSNHVYSLYDVLEGQKEQMRAEGDEPKEVNDEQVEETLASIGTDPAEISGRVGRMAPAALDEIDEMSDSDDDLPWEGLSDIESDLDLPVAGRGSRRNMEV